MYARITSLTLFILFMATASGLYVHYKAPDSSATTRRFIPGWQLPPLGIKWAAHKHTVIVAVLPGCPWCTASAPYYKLLLSRTSVDDFGLYFVSPAPVAATQSYLMAQGVNTPNVIMASFEAFPIEGTPTIFVANSQGKAYASYAGLLSKDRQRKLLRELDEWKIG